jgi:hypothetical protein
MAGPNQKKDAEKLTRVFVTAEGVVSCHRSIDEERFSLVGRLWLLAMDLWGKGGA